MVEFFGVVVFGLLAAGGFLLLAWHFDEETKRRLAKGEQLQKNSVEWLRRERDAARLRREIADIKQHDELRPVVLEAKKAILQGRADKRLLDAVFARRALDDVLTDKPQREDVDPIEGAVAKILEEIENRRADGQDTTALEELLRELRGMREGVSDEA